MKNSKKGFVAPLVVIIISILVITGGIFIYQKKHHNQTLGEVATNATSTDISRIEAFVKKTIADHNLTTLSLKCISIIDIDTYPNATPVAGEKDYQILEKHDTECGGDPNTAPRLFNVRLNTTSGEMSVYGIRDSIQTGTTTATTKESWKTYTNNQYGFSIQYPATGGVSDMRNGTFIVGVQSNSSENQRKLTIEVGPSSNCIDTTSGVDSSHIDINHVHFTTYNIDQSTREYCTVKNDKEYKLTTQISYTGTPVHVESDTVLHDTLNSFKFIPYTDANSLADDEALSLVSDLPEVKLYKNEITDFNNVPENKGHVVREFNIEVESKSVDGYVVWVYEIVGYEMPEADHATTFARYNVNTKTKVITKISTN